MTPVGGRASPSTGSDVKLTPERAAGGVSRHSMLARRISARVAIEYLQELQTTMSPGLSPAAEPHRGQVTMMFRMISPNAG
ncbi:MAG: hypothetical protein K0S00_3975 [Xanthobacteraceae bacterium]|nr:hypothetical protein [Xanthobacteraceae bacterium]